MVDRAISDLPSNTALALTDELENLDKSDTSESAEGTSKRNVIQDIIDLVTAALTSYDDTAVPITASQVQAAIDFGVFTNLVETGETKVDRIVQMSQTDFDLITPDANTFYVINGP